MILMLFQYYVGDVDAVPDFLNQFEASPWGEFYTRQNAKEEGVNLLLHYVAQFQNESIFSIFLRLLPMSEATILLKKITLSKACWVYVPDFNLLPAFEYSLFFLLRQNGWVCSSKI